MTDEPLVLFPLFRPRWEPLCDVGGIAADMRRGEDQKRNRGGKDSEDRPIECPPMGARRRFRGGVHLEKLSSPITQKTIQHVRSHRGGMQAGTRTQHACTRRSGSWRGDLLRWRL